MKKIALPLIIFLTIILTYLLASSSNQRFEKYLRDLSNDLYEKYEEMELQYIKDLNEDTTNSTKLSLQHNIDMYSLTLTFFNDLSTYESNDSTIKKIVNKADTTAIELAILINELENLNETYFDDYENELYTENFNATWTQIMFLLNDFDFYVYELYINGDISKEEYNLLISAIF